MGKRNNNRQTNDVKEDDIEEVVEETTEDREVINTDPPIEEGDTKHEEKDIEVINTDPPITQNVTLDENELIARKIKTLEKMLDSTQNTVRRAILSDQILALKKQMKANNVPDVDISMVKSEDDPKVSEVGNSSVEFSRGMVMDNRSSVLMGINI